MKKITSIVLLIAMLLSTLAFTSCYMRSYSGKETEFTLNSDEQSYTFAYMYLSEECDVVIPSEYNGLPVTKIAPLVFWNPKYLKSLTIPATVTYICDYAFSNCSNLEKVIFEEGSQLKTIDRCAFLDCSSLKSILIPESVERMSSTSIYIDCSEMPSARAAATAIAAFST